MANRTAKALKRARRRNPPGTPPGVLHIDPQAPPSVIRLLGFGPGGWEEPGGPVGVAELKGFLGRFPITWIHVEGLGDAGVLAALGEQFGIHGLALEDVVNVHQRPKVEVYPAHLFIVARAVSGGAPLDTDQLSLFLGKDYVLTFQERPGDVLEPVRQRIRAGRARFMEGGPDYLAYAILDTVLDAYFPVLEVYGDRIEALEEDILRDPQQSLVPQMHQVKRDLLLLRRDIWPMREALSSLYRDEHAQIGQQVRVYLRDCYDHAIQIIDLTETYRDINSDLTDFYLSSLNHRMNEVMKLLTIISTIFIPLSFVAGIYGMNFDRGASSWNMPELGWRFGYFFSLGVMALMAGAMLLYFRRKGWIGRRRGGPGGS